MQNITVSEKLGILTISLNRPHFRNALSAEMIEDLTKAFIGTVASSQLRGVHLRGEGKAFCAGADLGSMQEMVKYSLEKNHQEALVLHDMFAAIYECPVPVVVEAHGAAFGGALGLIATGDIVIAEAQTQFCFSEVKLGLVPALISDFISRKVALGPVSAWMLSGQVFGTSEALTCGLVHQSANSTELGASVEKTLQNLRDSGPEALRETKKLLRSIPSLKAPELRERTARVISARRVSAEGQEGLKAFLEKRRCAWRLS